MEDQQIDQEDTRPFLSYYVKPHNKISREVTEADMDRVLKDAHILYNLCFVQHGPYPAAVAMAHSQIDDQDPLRFFVTADKRVIINPVITNKTKTPVYLAEGCMSFPMMPAVRTARSHKITVDYDTLSREEESIIHVKDAQFSGREAQMFQHELGHFDGEWLFPIESWKPLPEEKVGVEDGEATIKL